MVLIIILVFTLLLTASVATFTRQAVVDTAISKNRDQRAQAEALARGGIELAKALLLEDKLREDGLALDTEQDLWAQVGQIGAIELEDGSRLRIAIEDTSTRLNLNAVIGGQGEDGRPNDNAEALLREVLDKIIEEMDIPPGEKALYDREDLVGNLIDYVDVNEDKHFGGYEASVYDLRDDLREPPNRPLLSVDELRAVEGYDSRLVEALRPYVTVYPYAGETGVNLNTAPPHVLALLYFDDGVELNLAREETIRQILKERQEGKFLCGGQSSEDCTPIGEIVDNEIFPPPSYESFVFTIVAEARVGEVTRSIEAVVDRKEAPTLRLLSWRVL